MTSHVAENYEGHACAKFILLGEHFIVHGNVPALSFPVHQLQTHVSLALQAAGDGVSCEATFRGRDGRVVSMPLIAEKMGRSIDLAADIMGFNLKKFGLRVKSQANFPVSRGFGSSASFSLALADALSQMVPGSESRIAPLVNALEGLFHGTPSGVDAATVMTGQPIRFENKKVTATISNHAVDFILLNSGERVGCKEIVSQVTSQRENNPEAWNEYASVMTNLVDKCQHGLASGNSMMVSHAIEVCHEILRKLGLSTDPIEMAIEEGRRLGALSGKVSGAGAGGAVVLVTLPGQGDGIARKMLDQGFDVLAVEKAHDAESSLGN